MVQPPERSCQRRNVCRPGRIQTLDQAMERASLLVVAVTFNTQLAIALHHGYPRRHRQGKLPFRAFDANFVLVLREGDRLRKRNWNFANTAHCKFLSLSLN